MNSRWKRTSKQGRRLDFIGKRFGRLLIVAFVGKTKNGHAQWLANCDCGKAVTVLGTNLVKGKTRACGCLHRELVTERHRQAAEPAMRTGKKTCTRKECSRANPQPLSQFHASKRQRDGHSGRCKTCSREVVLLRSYGISIADAARMLADQGGTCANRGCHRILSFDKNTCVDHDHQTGAVRGLLCRSCNTTLGLFGDSPERIRGLLEYATRHRQLTLLKGGKQP